MKEAAADGCHFVGDDEIWIAESSDLECVYETSCHEGYHKLRPDAPEDEVKRFGELLRALRWTGQKMLFGDRFAHRFEPEGVLLFADDLTVWRHEGCGIWEEVIQLA